MSTNILKPKPVDSLKSCIIGVLVLFICTPSFSQYQLKEIQRSKTNNRLAKMPFSSSSGEKGTTTFQYQKNGTLKHSTWNLQNNSRSSINFYKYDNKGNIIEKFKEFSDSLTSIEVFKYDTNNHLISEKFNRSDGISSCVKYTYKNNGELLKADWQKLHGWFNGIILYSYNKYGNLKHGKLIKDEKEVGMIHYQYDANKNLIEEYWKFPNSYNLKFNYIYETNPLISYTSSNVFITNTKNFRIKNETYNFNNKTGGPSIYQYVEDGKLTNKIFKVDGEIKTETTYKYDRTGILTQSTRLYANGDSTHFKYRYNRNRQLSERKYYRGEKIIGSELYNYKKGVLVTGIYHNFDSWLTGTIHFKHDNNGKIITGIFKGKNNFDANIIFEYDNDLNITKIHWEFSFGKTQTYTFQYEKLI